ncbi:DUF3006 family protein [Natrinema altunense]|uniref:DUF3006 domain-containing protein n=1 Tax=Natrinema altunense (strain JCM 12890 / CGMCC 1.3731 / AJ2) TaxID=1227494 RepID=L9ZI51_NATA2|nr:DUF3006 family protein [Natrinema altunense]ELY86175.1 hypothetical protein C485_10589 [Natrinema altunense JCM 12890]
MRKSHIAVLDRLVDGETAVLLLEAEGDVVGERTVAVETLPETGRHEGAVFEVIVAEDALLEATYRADIERERRESTRERFDRLSERLSDADRGEE